MNMSFFVMAKLLGTTRSVLFAGYFILSFSLLFAVLKIELNPSEIIFIVFSLLLALLHHYLSIRVKFDSDLLLMLYKKFDLKQADQDATTQQLDQILVSLGLMPQQKINRNWDLRFKGCFKLLKIQIAVLILQMMLLFALLIV